MRALFLILITAISLDSLGFNITGYNYDAINYDEILQAPSWDHLMGTDALGRDIFSRVLHGGQMSLFVALVTAFFSLLIGISFACLSAYAQELKMPWLDELIMRFIDFIYSLPDLLVLSVIALFFSQSTTGIVIALAFINWMDLARVVRVELKKLKSEEFVLAGKVIGLTEMQSIFKHLLPNIYTTVCLILAFTVARAILAETTLSFIGLGISPPNTSWGTLAGDAWQYLGTDPYLLFFPVLMIFIVVYNLNSLKQKNYN